MSSSPSSSTIVVRPLSWPSLVNRYQYENFCTIQLLLTHLLLGLNVHNNFLRLIRDGAKWRDGYLCPIPTHYIVTTTMTLHKARSYVRHFNVPLVVWARSQDSVHRPEFLKRKESRSGSNQGPSAHQPSALPLGHTGSQKKRRKERKQWTLRPQKPLRLFGDGEVEGS